MSENHRRRAVPGRIQDTDVLEQDPGLPPTAVDPAVAEAEDRRWPPAKIALWVGIALLGGFSWTMLAIVRGETVNAIWFVFAAVCTYLIGYRFYSKLIEAKLLKPNDRRATPAEYKADGKDFAATDRRVLYGHHFAAIAGAGPLVGPVLAAQMGYLPGTIWIIVGVVLAGAVQDYLVMFFSMRRGGRSLGQMARDELGVIGGTAALIATLVIMIIIVAILALVVVNALAESPWGVFSVSMTIPIALFMGVYLRYLRPGKVTEVSIIGFVLLLAAIIAGGWIADTPLGEALTLEPTTIAWGIIIYGFIAAVLPVWLLLAPRDYLSTFMKVGTIVMLAVAIIIVRPEINVPAVSEFAGRDDGPVVAGPLFPFLFVTIACGALSGFHALISSGTTPKMLEKERQTRFIGYGGMLMESFVAIMALVAAVSIDRGIYFAMAFWYHFAIMFEALFILTAVDAGTRVARFMLQDTIGNFAPKFKDMSWRPGAWVCTAVMVAGWGSILIMGVTDPLGGINTLFPLFGIANQLLAAIALAICMAIIAKNNAFRWLWIVALPLAFAAVVTITASFYKIFSPVPSVGYWANHEAFQQALEEGKTSFGTAKTVEAMEAVVRNTLIQTTLSVVFVTLAIIVIIAAIIASVRSFRSGGAPSAEDPAVPSRTFAPAGFLATPAEKEIMAQWDALPEADRPQKAAHS